MIIKYDKDILAYYCYHCGNEFFLHRIKFLFYRYNNLIFYCPTCNVIQYLKKEEFKNIQLKFNILEIL